MGIIDNSDLYSGNTAYVFSNPYNPYMDDSVDEYDEYYEKYQFPMQRFYEMLQENNIDISDRAEAMYVDLAWQAISKYLSEDYNDSAMLKRCSFAVAQLAYIYYYNDKIKREIIGGETPITQMTQGSRSVTFGTKKIELDNYGLTADIKAALPPRKLRAY